MKTYSSEILLACWLKGQLSRDELITCMLQNMIALERRARRRKLPRPVPPRLRWGRRRPN